MGNTLWIEAKGRNVEETHNDMSAMYHAADELDALARELKVTPISEFFDYSVLNDSFDEFEDDDDDDEDGDEEADGGDDAASDAEWWDSKKGLETFAALRKTLAEDFSRLSLAEKSKRTQEMLLEDLEFSEKILQAAVAAGQEFRFIIVP